MNKALLTLCCAVLCYNQVVFAKEKKEDKKALPPGKCCVEVCKDATKITECIQCNIDTAKLANCENREPGKSSLTRWMADIEESGTYCVPKGGDFRLWRANESEDTTLTFKETHSWKKPNKVFDWPEQEFPLIDNAKYTVSFGDQKSHFTFKIIPPELKGNDERKKWMNEQGCTIQAKRY